MPNVRFIDSASGQCARSKYPFFEGFLEDKHFVVLKHPSYSPDLALCDFYLVKNKNALNGTHFQSVEKVQEAND